MSLSTNKNKTALVFGNGTYENPSFYLKILNNNPNAFILAVDGGFNFLKKQNIKPDLLIGDLDSIKEKHDGIDLIQVKPEKDETDTRLALNYLLDNNFKKVILLGMFSLDRLDHSLANILILMNYFKAGMNIIIENYYNRISFLEGPGKKNIINKKGKTISIIPLTDKLKGLSISGVKYPLFEKDMKNFDADLTVSNEIISDDCSISLEEGIILIDLIAYENKKD